MASACAHAADGTDERLAKELSNPISDVISVPFQFNFDGGVGPNNGFRFITNIQPVVPIQLNEDWRVISRTILPFIQQGDVIPNTSQYGLGDTTQSFFFSPADGSGLVWGVGPAMLIPTATDTPLGAGKFGMGPTAVALMETGQWMYGILANQIWSVAGDDSRSHTSNALFQPFVAFHAPHAWTYTFQSETTYDSINDQATVPLNFLVSKVLNIGAQRVSLQAGIGYWAVSAPGGPEGLRGRAAVTLVYLR